jgi:hypothetical protein
MEKTMVRVFDVECYLEFARYPNGRRAIRLVDSRDDEEYAVATVNVITASLPPGHVAIKDYSENVGILEALVEAGVVTDTGVKVSTGFVSVPVVALAEAYR